MAFTVDLTKREAQQPSPGAKRWIVAGKELMLVVGEIKVGFELPAHQHPEEQITYVMKGKLAITLGKGEEEVLLRSGMVIVFEPNIRHGIKVLENARVVEVFHPPRESLIADAVRQ